SYRSGPANWVDARRGITLRDRDERSSLAIHVCFLRETGSSTSTTRNMEETGVLEKVNLSGFCYLALNQVPFFLFLFSFFLSAWPSLLRRDHFFLGQPRRIGQCLPNILDFEVWVIGQHLVPTGPVGDLPNDHRDGNAHAANTGTPTENSWVKRDAIKHGFSLAVSCVEFLVAISVPPRAWHRANALRRCLSGRGRRGRLRAAKSPGRVQSPSLVTPAGHWPGQTLAFLGDHGFPIWRSAHWTTASRADRLVDSVYAP